MTSSDTSTPDYHRSGPDLIARINELAKARNIDPDSLPLVNLDGNGWIWLLLACRRQLVLLDQWKKMNRELIATCKAVTESLKNYQQLTRTIETLCGDATE